MEARTLEHEHPPLPHRPPPLHTPTYSQVHLRASMARARAEVVKLEALERIAAAHVRQLRVRQQRSAAAARGPTSLARPSPSPFAWLRQAVLGGSSASGANQGSSGMLSSAEDQQQQQQQVEAERVQREQQQQTDADADSDGEEVPPLRVPMADSGITTATLELFTLVSRLRSTLRGVNVNSAGASEADDGDGEAAEPSTGSRGAGTQP